MITEDLEETRLKLRNGVASTNYSEAIKEYDVPSQRNKDGANLAIASPVFLIDPTQDPIPIGQNTLVSQKPGGTIAVSTAIPLLVAAGVSIFVCPVGKRRIIMSLCTDVIMTATVGNRVLQCRVRNGSNVAEWIGAASGNVTAGQTGGYDVSFGPPNGTPSTTVRRNQNNTANTNVQVRENCPINQMRAGDHIFIDDSADIDITDQVSAILTYIEFDA